MRRIRLLPRASFVAAVLCASGPGGAAAQGESLGERSKGRSDAPITIYEMSDFQCPFCRDFALTTMPELERAYVATGKVRFIYINYPLTSVHPHAATAARIALCAARQGKFWAVHDALFARQPEWAPRARAERYLVALADSAGTDHAKLSQCLATKASAAAVEADIAAAARAGARSTPTFYIEGGLIEGAAPVAVFRELLDSIYRSRTTTAR